MTESQWAKAKAAGDGNYSAGVRRRLDEWAAQCRSCNADIGVITGSQTKSTSEKKWRHWMAWRRSSATPPLSDTLTPTASLSCRWRRIAAAVASEAIRLIGIKC